MYKVIQQHTQWPKEFLAKSSKIGLGQKHKMLAVASRSNVMRTIYSSWYEILRISPSL